MNYYIVFGRKVPNKAQKTFLVTVIHSLTKSVIFVFSVKLLPKNEQTRAACAIRRGHVVILGLFGKDSDYSTIVNGGLCEIG